MTSPRPQLLIVGFGKRGRQWASLARSSSLFQVAGIVDPQAAARAFAEESGVPAHGSFEEALAGATPDATLICSPPESHTSDAIGALRRGLPVLIEKPLALSFGEGVKVALESQRSEVPVMVVQNFRYRPREVITFDLLRKGVTGPPTLSVITSSRTKAAAPAHVDQLEMAPLWDFCIHYLDILRMRFGTPWEVRAWVDRLQDDREALTAALGWKDGFRANLHHSEDAPLYRYQEWIEGPRGAIFLDHRKVWFVPQGRRPHRVRRPRAAGSPELHILERFRGALEGDPLGDLGVTDNLETMAIAEAVARSVRESQIIRPSEIHDSVIGSQMEE
jgi:predicted dehydrogenase